MDKDPGPLASHAGRGIILVAAITGVEDHQVLMDHP
jgi:hypothetical protein